MSRLQNHVRPIILFVSALVSFSFIDLLIIGVFKITHLPIINQYGIYIPAPIVLPAIFIIIVYPTLILPIVRSIYNQPFSCRPLILQILGGLFVFPILAIYTEAGIVMIAEFAAPLSAVPVVGKVVALRQLGPSFSYILIIITTYIATVVGILSSILIYGLMAKHKK